MVINVHSNATITLTYSTAHGNKLTSEVFCSGFCLGLRDGEPPDAEWSPRDAELAGVEHRWEQKESTAGERGSVGQTAMTTKTAMN